MKFLGFNKALCLSPHPDDVEFGMMGTVLKYTDTHFDIICLSSGGDFDTTSGKDRLQEVKEVWGEVDNISLFFSTQKHISDLTHDAWVNYIETNFTNKTNYDCLFVPTEKDSHFEHKKINELSFPLTRIKSLSIIEYRTPSTLDFWSPNTFVDITDNFEEKYSKLLKFVSQKDRWYFQPPQFRSFHSNFQSYKKGIEYVEQFNTIQLYKL